ncbi:unnamed protein product [Arctogadus glacialis]
MDKLVLVKQNKTWEGALEHCRALKVSRSFYNHPMFDILSFHTEEEPLGAAESQCVTSLGRRSLFIQPSMRQPYRPLYLHEALHAEQHADSKIPK